MFDYAAIAAAIQEFADAAMQGTYVPGIGAAIVDAATSKASPEVLAAMGDDADLDDTWSCDRYEPVL